MALSIKAKARLRAVAEKEGVGWQALVREVEAVLRGEDDPSEAPGPAPGERGPNQQAKVFLWNSYALKTNELRQYLGFEPDATDGDLYYGEWLLKHGGVAAVVQSPNSDQGGDDGSQ